MKAFGLARLGRDAEIRTTSGGDQVASLSLAFTRRVKGEKFTDWVDGALWGKRAEALAPYLKKGSLIVVTLEDLHIDTFRKSDGADGIKLSGRVIDVELAGGNDRTAAPAQRPIAPAPAPRQAAPQLPPAPNQLQQKPGPFDDFSDSIPF